MAFDLWSHRGYTVHPAVWAETWKNARDYVKPGISPERQAAFDYAAGSGQGDNPYDKGTPEAEAWAFSLAEMSFEEDVAYLQGIYKS